MVLNSGNNNANNCTTSLIEVTMLMLMPWLSMVVAMTLTNGGNKDANDRMLMLMEVTTINPMPLSSMVATTMPMTMQHC